MASYEVEHGVTLNNPSQTSTSHRRPDLSTFFSTLDLVDTTGDRRPNNVHALPLPADVGAAFLSLANGFATMLDGPEDESGTGRHPELASMVQWLRTNAEDPPKEIAGVPDSFVAELDRIPKKDLREGDSCPICHTQFLDDPYPLVVRLPCHDNHVFDLECITPWLKLNDSCPLDRKCLVKKREPIPPKDIDEEEYDDMYA